ncbi:MAG: F0F1 ATP synthase subunit delta [Nitrosomonas sp.]|nr:MAG: F0F1 ATP synthase subunit delta [Nitrosomonas sp.]
MTEVVTVARPYAEAVYKLGVANGNLEQWSKMLQLAVAISENSNVKLLIGNPEVTGNQLGEIFLGIGDGKFNSEACNLIMMLSNNKRISYLSQISQLFEQLRAQYEGILEAKIVSAFAMESKQFRRLVDYLEQRFKRKVEATVTVDPELIGGVKVEIGDEILDASIKGKLEAMTVALKS